MPLIVDISKYSPSQFNELILSFKSKSEELNNYLKRYSYNHSIKNATSKTYLFIEDGVLLSYITLAIETVSDENKNYNVYKSLSNLGDGYSFTIPTLKIARLATDINYCGTGYGSSLIQLAFIRALILQMDVGCNIITVDAKNDAIEFYEKNGFAKINEGDEKITSMLRSIIPIKKLTNSEKEDILNVCTFFQLYDDRLKLSNYFNSMYIPH